MFSYVDIQCQGGRQSQRNANKIVTMNLANLHLETIKDFDFGVGDDLDEYVRVSSLPVDEVTLPEVKLIIWILLEKTFRQKQKDAFSKDDTDGSIQSDGRAGAEKSIENYVKSTEVDGFGGRGSSDRSVDQSVREAKEYTFELLRFVGVDIPFESLTEEDKSRLLGEFSASSELLSKEKYTTIIELYEALRRRSKFRENFLVIENLGRGRFGRVDKVKAVMVDLPGDHFAVKQIRPAVECLDEIKMLLTESKSLKELSGHPNVVHFHDSWLAMDCSEEESDDGFVDDSLVFYLHMELCGESLRKWKERVQEGPRPSDFETLSIMIAEQLISGLEWIHDHGILHLDINPSNLFWKDESCRTVKIGDFGLAVHGEQVSGRRGTSPYCASERLMTQKSDIYSAGVTLFELAQLIKTRQELNTRLEKRDLATGVRKLDQVLPRMLSKLPNGRPSAAELLDMLRK